MGKRDFQSESLLNVFVKRIITASRTSTRCFRIKIITEANLRRVFLLICLPFRGHINVRLKAKTVLPGAYLR